MLTYKQVSKLAKPYTDKAMIKMGQLLHNENGTAWGNRYIAFYELAPDPPKNHKRQSVSTFDDILTNYDTEATIKVWPIEIGGSGAFSLKPLRLTDDMGHSWWVNSKYFTALWKRDKEAHFFASPQEKHIVARNEQGETIGILMCIVPPADGYRFDWSLRNLDTPNRPYTPVHPRAWIPRDGYVKPEPLDTTDFRTAYPGQKETMEAPAPVTVTEQAPEPEPEPAPVMATPEPGPVPAPEPIPEPQAIVVEKPDTVDQLATLLAGLGYTEIYTEDGHVCAIWERVPLNKQCKLKANVTHALNTAGLAARVNAQGYTLTVRC